MTRIGPTYQKILTAILVMGMVGVGMSGLLSDQGMTIGDVVHTAVSMSHDNGIQTRADRAELLDLLARAIDDRQVQADGIDGNLSSFSDIKVRLGTMISGFFMACFLSGALVLAPCFSLLFFSIPPSIPPPEIR
jgi:hypothetical protein